MVCEEQVKFDKNNILIFHVLFAKNQGPTSWSNFHSPLHFTRELLLRGDTVPASGRHMHLVFRDAPVASRKWPLPVMP